MTSIWIRHRNMEIGICCFHEMPKARFGSPQTENLTFQRESRAVWGKVFSWYEKANFGLRIYPLYPWIWGIELRLLWTIFHLSIAEIRTAPQGVANAMFQEETKADRGKGHLWWQTTGSLMYKLIRTMSDTTNVIERNWTELIAKAFQLPNCRNESPQFGC